jgi:hypothetical protein
MLPLPLAVDGGGSSVSLQGSLRDFGVPEIFQLIAQQGKTGVLEVKGKGQAFEVSFREGRVARARPAESRPDDSLADLLLRSGVLQQGELSSAREQQKQTLESLARILEERGSASREDLEKIVRILTQETIFDLFRCEEGNFRFRPEPVEPSIGDQNVGADHVLLDSVRMKDEWPLIEARLPDLGQVPVACVDLESFRTKKGSLKGRHGIAETVLEDLFMLIDGRSSARRVIDRSRLGTFDGARGLVALERVEVIRFDAPAKDREPSRGRSRARRTGVAVVVPGVVVLVLAMTLAGTLWLSQREADPTLPVPVDTLSASRHETEGLRIRAALEVTRWVAGGYPESLEALADQAPPSLAPPGGGRYSYSRTPGGYYL